MGKKSIHHICIQTNQYHESLAFYTRILEFEMVKETPNFHGRGFNSWLRLGDFYIELQTPKVSEVEISMLREAQTFEPYNKDALGIVHFCLYCESLEAEYIRIQEAGFLDFLPKKGEVVYQVEEGKLLKMKAPEGTIIELRDGSLI